MNKVIQAIAVLATFIFADTITLLNGQEIQNATITEISETEIKYKIGERAIVYSVRKDGIAKISYPDGTEDVFVPIAAAPTAAPATVASGFAVAPASTAVAQPATGEKSDIGFITGLELGITSVSLGITPVQGQKTSSTTGFKIGLSGGTSIPISSIASFKPGLDFFYRTYNINNSQSSGGNEIEDNLDFKELGLGISALFQTMLTEKFYQELGIKLDFPFSCNVDYEHKDSGNSRLNTDETYTCDKYGKDEASWGARELFDIGLVFGFGYLINENISVGFRGMLNFMNPYPKIGYRVNHYGLGVYYSM